MHHPSKEQCRHVQQKALLRAGVSTEVFSTACDGTVASYHAVSDLVFHLQSAVRFLVCMRHHWGCLHNDALQSAAAWIQYDSLNPSKALATAVYLT